MEKNKFLINGWVKDIYDDYDMLNKDLIKEYDIDIPSEIKESVGFKKGKPKNFDFESICDFIDLVGRINIEDCINTRAFNDLYQSKK